MKNTVKQLIDDWTEQNNARLADNRPELPNSDIIPIFLQVDSNLFDAEQLYSFGIEVIAEEDGGYIIGASGDNFTSLKEKIDKFIKKEGKFKDKAAQLWNIIQGNQWRIDYILSDELKAKWDQIEDDEVMLVDISVACYIKISKAPSRKEGETVRQYEKRYDKWLIKKTQFDILRGDLEMQRQDDLDDFINKIRGERKSDFVGYDDSFSCRVQFSGEALKDFVLNYQYLFDVSEYDALTYEHPETGEESFIEVEFIAPAGDSPKICVIDSGIQEEHRLIADAIETGVSKSYLPGNDSVADDRF